MRTCIAATRKVSHAFIYKYVYKLKVSGAHAPLGPTVDTPLLGGIHGVGKVLYTAACELVLFLHANYLALIDAHCPPRLTFPPE